MWILTEIAREDEVEEVLSWARPSRPYIIVHPRPFRLTWSRTVYVSHYEQGMGGQLHDVLMSVTETKFEYRDTMTTEELERLTAHWPKIFAKQPQG